MNVLLVLLLLGAIYLFLEAGLVFFAMIVGVALLLAMISSAFSPKEGNVVKAASPASPSQPPQYVKQNHDTLQKFWMLVGMAFNFVGKGIYNFLRFGFQTAGKKQD